LSLYHNLRIPNIIIVSMTLWIMAQKVLYPILIDNSILPTLSNKELYLLIFLTICITAGGYLFNDIVDIQRDIQNDKRSFISSNWEKRIAYVIYIVITLSPIPFALSLAMEINHPEYIFLYFVVVLLLLIYNLYLKNLPLLGNILVAFLCSSVILLLLLAEFDSIQLLKLSSPKDYKYLIALSIYYGAFAFFTNLIREIIKDVEDIEGDLDDGAYTFPLAMGINKTQYFLLVLHVFLLLFLIFWVIQNCLTSVIQISFSLALLILPAIYLLRLIYKSKIKKDYSELSRIYKLWMVGGLVFLIAFVSYN